MTTSQTPRLVAEHVSLLPNTLPVTDIATDLSPYHYVLNDKGNLSLRKGAPPKEVRAATAEFTAGRIGLDAYLDRVGVPKR